MKTGLKQDRLWISVWVSGVVVLLRMKVRCAGEAAKGVAHSGFPSAGEQHQVDSAAPAGSPLRAASRDRMRFFALALLCRKR